MKLLNITRTPRTAWKGFTLTELLIVIVVIALLAAMLFPVFFRSREAARRAACQNNLRQIGMALQQYSEDYDGASPPRYGNANGELADKNPLNWRVIIFPYVGSAAVFQCPSNPEKNTSATNLTVAAPGTPDLSVSYGCNYDSGTGLGSFSGNGGMDLVREVDFPYPAETISVAETTSTRPDIDMDDVALFGKLYAAHNGLTNYLFVDGHVKALRPLQTYYAGAEIRNMWHRDHSEFEREE